MSEIKKLPTAISTGSELINRKRLVGAVLDDFKRTRVFSERSLANAFGFKGGGAYWKRKKEGGADLPEYLSSPLLKDFISSELKEKLDGAVTYISQSKIVSTGIEATALPLICDVYVKASAKNPDNDNLKIAADAAYQIILKFSQVGVLSWVDTITGYRYQEEDQTIVRQLSQYVAPEILEWQREFQSDFYRELFRLKGWPYNPYSVSRPGIVGTYTNMYIYSFLPKNVFDFIKDRTPKSKAGNYIVRLHQSLNKERGKELLRNQLISVTTLMKISKSWEDFRQKFQQLYGQQVIDFGSEPVLKLDYPSEKDSYKGTLFDSLLKGVLSVPPPKKEK